MKHNSWLAEVPPLETTPFVKPADEKRLASLARKQESQALTQVELRTLRRLLSKKKVERERQHGQR